MNENNVCVVVGAGHAGGRAVEALRKYRFGGRIVLVGAEQALPLERPPLSKAYLANPDQSLAPPIRDRQWYRDNNVELHLGVEAVALNAETKTLDLADGERLQWHSLILTTGGRVRRLPVAGDDLNGVHYLRTLSDADSLAQALTEASRVAVVGGGFIGLEAASVAAKSCDVTVIEAGSSLMGRAVASEIATVVQQRFEKAGINVVTDASAERFVGDGGKVMAVALANGSLLQADCVIVGVGIEPGTALAAEAGIKVDNGIVVDEYCRTSATDVYAAGDVASHYSPIYDRHIRLESWQNAQNQAIAAARNVAGESVPYSEVPWFWSDQLDYKIQVAGAAQDWDSIQIRGDGDPDMLLFQVFDGKVVGLQSIGALKDMRRARKLLDSDHDIGSIDLTDTSIAMKDVVSAALKK